jgi:hypothetical protein
MSEFDIKLDRLLDLKIAFEALKRVHNIERKH